MSEKGQHKNDMYGNIDARSEQEQQVVPPIPAATVVLARDGDDGPEVLMLRKNSQMAFGGMWVFPGGKIDDADRAAGTDENHVARIAAARETLEETGLTMDHDHFHWFARWTPPPGPNKRFTTWFFAAEIDHGVEVTVDGGEIGDHAWLRPDQALQAHAAGEIDLVPPTWVTLYYLSRYSPTSALLARLARDEPKIYSTRVGKDHDGVRVAMWHGDAGYDSWDATVSGDRHRLVMARDGFIFENTVEEY